MTDPSWLYSTIAQSSAAIIAIIGGFITHSVITLLNEKRSINNQLSDKRSELEEIKKPLPIVRKNKLTPEEIESRKELVNSNKIKISLLEATISDLETRLNSFRYPPHLRLAAYILLLFAFFSIVLPASLILNEVFSPIMKQVTFYLFIAGLVAVITYIYLLTKEIRK